MSLICQLTSEDIKQHYLPIYDSRVTHTHTHQLHRQRERGGVERRERVMMTRVKPYPINTPQGGRRDTRRSQAPLVHVSVVRRPISEAEAGWEGCLENASREIKFTHFPRLSMKGGPMLSLCHLIIGYVLCLFSAFEPQCRRLRYFVYHSV